MLHLRKELNLSKTAMGEALGIPRTTLAGYEEGNFPTVEKLIAIADYFGVTLSELVQQDLSKGNLNKTTIGKKTPEKGNLKGNPKGNLIAVNEPGTSYQKTEIRLPFYGARTPQVITVTAEGRENIIYVPVKARAGYLLGLGDPEYMESLPTFSLPGLHNASFRMFEVEGNSMAPVLLNRDRIIGEWVESLANIRENRVHIVVHKDGILIKRLVNRLEKRGKIYAKSDSTTNRHDYPTLELDPEDIREVWYAHLKLSADFSEPAELYHRINDIELRLLEIEKENKKKRAN